MSAFAAGPAFAAPVIPKGAEWEYQLAPDEDPALMSTIEFDASAWKSGRAGFGYGDDDDATVLEMRGKVTRLAIRHSFELPDGLDPASLTLSIRYDDAFEVWLNGVHLFDRELERKGGRITKVSGHEAFDDAWEAIRLAPFAKVFHPDSNCLLIIGHNVKKHSSDFTLDPYLGVKGLDKKSVPFGIAEGRALVDKFRLVWADDPTTFATIVWNQISGAPGTVHYGTRDLGEAFDDYPRRATVTRSVDQDPMLTCMVQLKDLEPDTPYFFCIRDERGVSRRLSFRTAPREPRAFTFIAGGDSRNGRKTRVLGNQTAARLRPLFVAFTGDLVASDRNSKWVDWLDDWQHSISEDGRMIPLVPHRGNHERRPQSIHETFGTPEDAYYAFSIGGDLFRYYVLNSEIPAQGAQGDWLGADLAAHRGKVTHLVAGYHKPIRPHVSGKSEGRNPERWAPDFYLNGIDLAIESDSHVMKRTLPLRPDEDGDEGFSHSADDKNATVFIGEGCWGAPLRDADDGKDWTVAKGSFNGFDWIHVTPEHMAVKTVRFGPLEDVAEIDPREPFATPTGLRLWEPESGQVLIVPGDR